MSEQVVVRCPSCSQKYRVSHASVGHKARCKVCAARFRISSEPQVDDDTIFAWITEDDPAAASVMGGTGIFPDHSGEHTSVAGAHVAEYSLDPAAAAQAYELRLARIDTEGAHFEFPASALASERLRNSFPRKCIGCGARGDLQVHLIYWRERMPTSDALTWQARQDAPIGRLATFERPYDAAILRQLPLARGLEMPFSLPFPLYTCTHCRASREVQGRVGIHSSQEVCRLTVASLAVAVDFFRDNGGRNDPDYHRLIEERDQRPDSWRSLDARVRQRVSQWFGPREDERFVGFFGDADFPVHELGGSGLVLTSRRLVFHKYAACRDYPLDHPGRVEIIPRGAQSAVHIYDKGDRPSILKLDPAIADDLAGQLRRLHTKWMVVSR